MRVDLSLQAGGQTDESGGVGAEGFLVDARFVVEPFHVGDGVDFREIEIAFIIFSQKHQMVIRNAVVAT